MGKHGKELDYKTIEDACAKAGGNCSLYYLADRDCPDYTPDDANDTIEEDD